jgi:histidine triad (HIT) family protein
MDEACVFCSIVSGDLQSEIIDSSDTCLAINDNSPVASTHVLVIPREHVLYLSDLDHKDLYIVQDMYALAHKIVKSCELMRTYPGQYTDPYDLNPTDKEHVP